MSMPWLAELRGVTARLLAGAAVFLMSGLAFADYALNFQRPVTEIARDILNLHNLIVVICAVILVVVFSVMFYALFAHRKSRGHKAATFHDNSTVEMAWTIVPFVILIGMAIPSTSTLLKMDDVSGSEMTVKITGYQWKWRYDYLDHDVGFFSVLSTPREQIENKADKGDHYLLEVDSPLVLPVGKKVRILVTANDVIHSWWVPALGVKKDAIPGFINEIWTRIDEPGIYRGQCAELCGKDHGFMPVVVKAVSVQEFAAWVMQKKELAAAAAAAASQTWSMAQLMSRGKVVYSQCAACHGPTGQGVPGVFPAIAGSKVTTGPIEENLRLIMEGVPGTAMQAFAEQLNDVDIAAVATYQRNAFGNNTGDLVQPSQVKALRKLASVFRGDG
ncbi:MAG: cytochrome c oxidase subunit II [Acidiferrobacterales bacterium]|jgi:cytochrome c oxidase subunit 2